MDLATIKVMHCEQLRPDIFGYSPISCENLRYLVSEIERLRNSQLITVYENSLMAKSLKKSFGNNAADWLKGDHHEWGEN